MKWVLPAKPKCSLYRRSYSVTLVQRNQGMFDLILGNVSVIGQHCIPWSCPWISRLPFPINVTNYRLHTKINWYCVYLSHPFIIFLSTNLPKFWDFYKENIKKASGEKQQTVSVIAHATTLQESWSSSVSFTRVFVTRHVPNQRRPWGRGWDLHSHLHTVTK